MATQWTLNQGDTEFLIVETPGVPNIATTFQLIVNTSVFDITDPSANPNPRAVKKEECIRALLMLENFILENDWLGD